MQKVEVTVLTKDELRSIIREEFIDLVSKSDVTGYFGNADPRFGDIDPSCSKWFKEQIA